MGWALSINQADISDVHIAEAPGRDLQEGEVTLAVRRFALTANNITYAVFGGPPMRYWAFFPGEDGRGRVPVWGFADVVESRSSEIGVGERIYGYFPAASELVVRPGRVAPDSFVDLAVHREDLPSAYNRYVRCAADPSWSADREEAQMVLQPLFITSFLIAEFLKEEKGLGAETIGLTSASSKTALALAWMLRSEPIEGATVEALTSPAGAKFLEPLGLYDSICLYDDIESLSGEGAYAIIDFAGDSGLNRRLHTQLGERLKANIRVGGAHWTQSAPTGDLPGPKPEFFFAPDHARQRAKAWGQDVFERRYKAAWEGFVADADTFLDYETQRGGDGALNVYRKLVAGAVSPKRAQIISA